MSLNIYKSLVFSLLIALTYSGCSDSKSEEAAIVAPPGTTTPSATTSKKTLFAIYMMGSDLETNYRAGSSDLREMLLGYYNNLTPDQQSNIEIEVAFGGSKASNWSGVKYADADCLLDDYNADNIFGNASCYTYQDATANMSASSTLTNFINSLSLSTASYDKTIFTFWNHGGAYGGVCYDERGTDALTLAELDSSLSSTSSYFDIIGMDACLMGNLEVAKTLSKYGKYLIASEESVPAHGWNYEELLGWLGENSSATLSTISKKFVDSFMDSPAHASTVNKTLSVVDLKKIDNFLDGFNDILTSLDATNDFNSILSAAKESQQYALDSRDSIPIGTSMDLKHFLQNLKINKTELSTQINRLNGMIDDFVIYNRYQNTKINSNGISVFQPINVGEWNNIYRAEENFISAPWYNLIGDFLTIGLNDNEAPVKTSESSCQYLGTDDGYCMNVTDNVGISDAESYNLIPYGDDYLLLSTDKLVKTDTEYFLEKQEDNWLYFCDGESCIFPSAIFIGEYDNNYVYASYANVNGKYSEFYMAVNNLDGSFDYWAVEVNDNGVASKTQTSIKQGDTLQFYYYIISMNGSDNWIVGDSLTFSQAPNVLVYEMGVDVTYFASFSDFKGNSITSNLYTTPAD